MTNSINQKLNHLAIYPPPIAGNGAINAPGESFDDPFNPPLEIARSHTLSDDHRDAEQTFLQLFKGKPLPHGLTFDEAVGPLRERVKDFLDYPVQSPAAMLYKKWALNGVKVTEFSKLPRQNRNYINTCETLLPETPSEKCAMIAFLVKKLIRDDITKRQQKLIFGYLFSATVPNDPGNDIPDINFGTLSKGNPLFNPLRLIDAVYKIYYPTNGQWQIPQQAHPSQSLKLAIAIADFGWKEAFPFMNTRSFKAPKEIPWQLNFLLTARKDLTNNEQNGDCLPVTVIHPRCAPHLEIDPDPENNRLQTLAFPVISEEETVSDSDDEESSDTISLCSSDYGAHLY